MVVTIDKCAQRWLRMTFAIIESAWKISKYVTGWTNSVETIGMAIAQIYLLQKLPETSSQSASAFSNQNQLSKKLVGRFSLKYLWKDLEARKGKLYMTMWPQTGLASNYLWYIA